MFEKRSAGALGLLFALTLAIPSAGGAAMPSPPTLLPPLKSSGSFAVSPEPPRPGGEALAPARAAGAPGSTTAGAALTPTVQLFLPFVKSAFDFAQTPKPLYLGGV